ncbi:adenylate/guanylate cyclase domain-containing protein [Novipirellula caenicola]|uniref:Guanylate cyclase domain-containing protein n=1 Tax=Novipirellula caenicola TaxID=1536901 RepID=A0ABP9VRH1_9BACT
MCPINGTVADGAVILARARLLTRQSAENATAQATQIAHTAWRAVCWSPSQAANLYRSIKALKTLSISKTRRFAEERFAFATKSAKSIHFSTKSASAEILAEDRIIANSLIEDDEFADLETGTGVGTWSSVLAIDLRGSTAMAEALGGENTYVLVHTLLPTLAWSLKRLGGTVMNYRGDGVFAGFGLTKVYREQDEPESHQKRDANQTAITSGFQLLEAVQDAIQPVLNEGGIDVSLSIGIGIESGAMVVTKVGWLKSHELTAYGSPINRACHLTGGTNSVRVGPNAWATIPTSPDGTLFPSAINGGFEISCSEKMASV